jgi:hypothetical protein
LYFRIQEYEKKGESACFQHLKVNPKHHIDYKAIDVVDRPINALKLRIKERLHIISEKPEMNKQLHPIPICVGSQSSYELKTILVAN